MATRNAAKIVVSKVAMELILTGKAPDLVPDHRTLTREGLLAAVVKIVQKDRLDLTDDKFRAKYVSFIRKYWGGKPLRDS